MSYLQKVDSSFITAETFIAAKVHHRIRGLWSSPRNIVQVRCTGFITCYPGHQPKRTRSPRPYLGSVILSQSPAPSTRMQDLVIGWPLATDANVLTSFIARRNRAREQELDGRVTLIEGIRYYPGVSIKPSVSCVRSFDPIENPSKYSRNSSARTAFDGSSHIMITSRPFLPRSRPFSFSSSMTAAPHPMCARRAP